ncbi:hypothetical protein LK533_16670 [Sphingomonas sp. PL-96]|uniref:hypothetical protein n=1 Tax=Sphingomonas sp. PL-96 TaxID=2887201 RepID=UPI001E4DCB22|nr:hypothetical protein [Sphingomonas sp. PL-96]MCC2978285.1 hypothetical protein [Sphingomonas sp. PL-96]
MTIFGRLGMAVALGSMTVATVMPAQAQAQRANGWNRGGDRSWNGNRGWNRGRGTRNHDRAAAGAVLGGLLGLGLGAAIASSARDRYHRPRGYAYDTPPQVTYRGGYYNDAPPPPPRGYYRQTERWDY